MRLGEWALDGSVPQRGPMAERHQGGGQSLAGPIHRAESVRGDRATLAGTGFGAHRLELEITERIFMENSENTLATLRRLKRLGVRIALDDFGTGYSSL